MNYENLYDALDKDFDGPFRVVDIHPKITEHVACQVHEFVEKED